MRCANTGARETFAEVNGCRIRYLTVGAGPAIILIHGLFGYSFSWRYNLASLAKHFTVYALDLPGVGFSERSASPRYGLAALAQDVLEFLKLLDIRDPILAGSSHGGGIAMMIAAAREPGMAIPKLILVSPVNPWSRQGAGRAAFFGSRMGSALLRCFAPVVPLTHLYFLKRMYGDPSRLSDESLAGYDCALRVPGTLPHMLARVRRWNADLELIRATLPAIAEVPTLLIWGSRDRAVPLASAFELQKRFKHAELAVIEGAGHLPYEEMPEEFNRIAQRFLDSSGPCPTHQAATADRSGDLLGL
ncbi:MAG TPA: alpha/beta fold hydrolase [Terriglobales bacterium]|nr:alpha/beta fold hydrolase [Terriglobales bacterium]